MALVSGLDEDADHRDEEKDGAVVDLPAGPLGKTMK
jgi:hypothetical protein